MLLGSVFFATGCSLLDIKEQTEIVDNLGALKGTIKVTSRQKGPVVVVPFHEINGILVRENQTMASSTGKYKFDLIPGIYSVFAFIDVNKDGEFQRGKEHGNYHPGPLFVQVDAKQTVTFKALSIGGDPPLPSHDLKVEIKQDKIIDNIGKVTTLSSKRFTRENYSMGMWRPIDFLDQVDAGLLMLQVYDPRKKPVIFVHGMNGGPTDFQNLIHSLDKRRFQPWVLYYPTGIRLDIVSDYFVEAVQALKHRHNFNDFSIIAHSMGGLVTRSFIKKYTKQFPEHAKKINMVVTVNSPMGGMASAASGVKNSPIVVPAWRDVAANSEFIKELHTWDWPHIIPYYVIFSYFDGVVALNSQLPFKLQSENSRMYGFNNDHVGTLNDNGFITLMNSLLNKHTK